MKDLDVALANPASLPADLALLAKTLAARMHSEQVRRFLLKLLLLCEWVAGRLPCE